MLNPWIYKVKYLSNYDGDTIKFNRDCGCNISHKITVRLCGIDTAEIRNKDLDLKKKAYEAKEYVACMLASAHNIWIETTKDKKGKYGRYLAIVWYQVAKEQPVNLNDELVSKYLAIKKEY